VPDRGRFACGIHARLTLTEASNSAPTDCFSETVVEFWRWSVGTDGSFLQNLIGL
jgi:hypothetical protein